MEICDKSLENLANGIILQAVDDYVNAFWGKSIERKAPEDVMAECERFFHSDLYRELTTVDGDYIMKNVKIKELVKTIGIYREALSLSRSTTIRISVAKVTEKKATKDTPAVEGKPAINYIIPPRLVSAIEDTLRLQMKQLEAELKAIREDEDDT